VKSNKDIPSQSNILIQITSLNADISAVVCYQNLNFLSDEQQKH
jgi:hypothetical protein